MKAILEFDLDEPEDHMNHTRCLQAQEMALFIWELQHNFWRKWKHDESKFTLEAYQEALAELMDDHSIDIDKLM